MFKFLLVPLLLSLAAVPLWSAETDLTTDSASWPFNVRVRPEALGDLPQALVQHQGVLLRIEDDGHALVDFGRDGIHRLAVDRTDVPEQAAALRAGTLRKDLPNFFRYTANIIFSKRSDGQYGPIPVDVFSRNAFCLVVYGDARLVDDADLKAGLDRLHGLARERGGVLVVLPTEHAFYTKAASAQVEWPMVVPHMSIAFVRTLQHYPETADLTAVAVDPEGRLLGRWQAAFADRPALLAAASSWLEAWVAPSPATPDVALRQERDEAAARARAELEAFKISPSR